MSTHVRFLCLLFTLILLLPVAGNSQSVIGPLLQIEPAPLDFDTTLCRTTKCLNVTFRNIGDTVLSITSMDAFAAPFSGSVALPLELQPNQARTVTLCYHPTSAPSMNSQVINYTGDDRVAMSVGLLFDHSGSMMAAFPGAVSRWAAAVTGGTSFINSMLSTASIMDEAAIMSFDDAYLLRQPFTPAKTTLINALNAIPAPTGITALYEGIRRAILDLAPRTQVRVLIVLSDGVNTVTGTSEAQAIAAAQAAGIPVYTVFIGSSDPTAIASLQRISTQTGGQSYQAANQSDLNAVYRSIVTRASLSIPKQIRIDGRAVAPILTIAPTNLAFPAVPVGLESCKNITLRNTGDAPMHLAGTLSAPFHFDGSVPADLAPGVSVDVRICFRPTQEGLVQRTAEFNTNSCMTPEVSLSLRAEGVTQVLGPIVVMDPLPLDFDTTLCSTEKCLTVTFRNIGDSVASVNSTSIIPLPFSATMPLPFSLDPGETRDVNLCYAPIAGPATDNANVQITANSRVPMSMALVQQNTLSMLNDLEPSLTRLDAVGIASGLFISRLLNLPRIQDEAALFTYESVPNFTLAQDFTTDQSLLLGAIPSTAAGTVSCLFDAIQRGAQALASQPKKRVLVLFSSDLNGTGCGPLTAADAINAANAAGVTVYTIGIGAADASILNQIATQTGGIYSFATTAAELRDAYLRVVDHLSRNQELSLPLQGRSVTPIALLDPAVLNFPATKSGEEVCRDITVQNVGDGPLFLRSILNLGAPFRIDQLPTAPIPPGGSNQVRICFAPLGGGMFEKIAMLQTNSCEQEEVAFTVRGLGIVDTEVRGPILTMVPNPLDFDTVSCGTEKCLTLRLGNAGDTLLTVRDIDAIPAPFSGTIPVPFTLDPGQSRDFTLCYLPQTAPAIDSAVIPILADTRVPLSIGMLFDVSGSMTNNEISPGVTRIEAANYAGTSFISGLLNLPTLKDEAAVLSFAASADFTILQPFTSDKDALRAAVPTTAIGQYTCLFDGLMQTIAAVSLRPQQKVVIVLADGDNNCNGSSPSETAIINAANAAGVVIYTIGIGGSNPVPLQNFASSTGGSFFTASSNTELIDVYRQIATLLSRNQTVYLRMRGRAVAPMLTLNPADLQFDSVLVGQERCLDVTVRNTGDAPLRISDIISDDSQFLAAAPVQEILPGASQQVSICFRPQGIREQSATLDFEYRRCAEDQVPLTVTGIGWDSLTIALTGSFVERPDRTISVPVRIVGRPLPANYDVRDYHLMLTYNTTVIMPDPSGEIDATGTMSTALPTLNFQRNNMDDAGIATLDGSGGTALAGAGDLVKLRMRVLLGNSMETEFRLVDAQMADGNPRLNILTPASVRLDSTCYLPERLINARTRYSLTLLSTAPNPSRGWTIIRYRLASTTNVRLRIMSALGEIVRTIDFGMREEGIHQYELGTDGLSPGVYYCRLEAGGQTAFSKLIVAR